MINDPFNSALSVAPVCLRQPLFVHRKLLFQREHKIIRPIIFYCPGLFIPNAEQVDAE